MIAEENVQVIFNERLNLISGVQKNGAFIKKIEMESGLSFFGKMFIDATYEGDLMAKTGVSYTIGRESNDVYNETLNGVQTKNAIYHQFKNNVDPYLITGDPESGLLPGIQNDGRSWERGKRRSPCSSLLLSNVSD